MGDGNGQTTILEREISPLLPRCSTIELTTAEQMHGLQRQASPARTSCLIFGNPALSVRTCRDVTVCTHPSAFESRISSHPIRHVLIVVAGLQRKFRQQHNIRDSLKYWQPDLSRRGLQVGLRAWSARSIGFHRRSGGMRRDVKADVLLMGDARKSSALIV